MKMKKSVWVVSLMLIVGLLFAGCSASGEEELSALEAVKAKGKIVVGTSADYPPYEFHTEINGEDTYVGFDMDIAKKIADDLGVELEIVDMKFDGLLAALTGQKIDFIAAGMNPSEERKKSVDFSLVYYDAHSTMLVAADMVDTLKTPEDFAGLKVGVQKATIQEGIADEQFPESEKVAIGKIPNLIMELQSGKIDGIILAEVVASSYADNNDDIAVNGLDLGSEGGVALAINKGQEDLLAEMNKTLETIMADGTLNEYIVKATELASQE
jgi:polar amino acid transport system substrate-binding protein